jgi:predicted DNA-binding transcriptional regulator AlpA
MDTLYARNYHLIDTLTLSAITGVKVATLKQWRSREKGPSYVKLGTKIMYRSDAVDSWLEDNTVNINEPTHA